MKFLNLGSGSVTVDQYSNVVGAIISPSGPVSIANYAQVSGAIVAQSVSLSSNAALHQDTRITSQADPISLGPSTPKPDAWIRVVN